MPIAAPTGKCEIGGIGLSAVLDRDDVIHLVREEGDICGKETVLTSLARSLSDVPAQAGGDSAVRHDRLVRCGRLPALSSTSTCSMRSNSSSSTCSAGVSRPLRL